MEHSASLDLAHFERAEFYDALQRARQDASQRPIALLTETAQFIQSAVSVCVAVGLLTLFSPIVFLLALVVGALSTAVEMKYAGKNYQLQRRVTALRRETQYISYLLTSVENFKEVRVFGLASALLARYKSKFDTAFARTRRLLLEGGMAGFLVSGASAIAFIGFYSYAVFLTASGRLTLGYLTLYGGAFATLQAEAAALARHAVAVREHELFISNLFEFLELRPEVVSTPRAVRLAAPGRRRCLELRNVSFRYGRESPWALRDLSLRLPYGQRIALVGQNGAGKTTLAKLLCRFYDPEEGELLFDGVDLRDLALDDYQSRIGVLFQDFGCYQFSARENIAFGCLPAAGDKARVERAAVACGVDKIVGRLPSGYESRLGRYFEDGQQLSGGEWQMIALARAMMRESEIFVCDEPTASLDPLREEQVLSSILQAGRGRICVIISHRLSTAAAADRVIVLERGRAIEDGSHRELIARGGVYAKLFRAQAARYESRS